MTESLAANSEDRISSDLDFAIGDLQSGASQLPSISVSQRRELVDACVTGVVRNAKAWVEAACSAKKIARDKPIAAEEILAGPTSLLRYLRLLSGVFRDIEQQGSPKLPGKTRRNSLGQTCAPILPVRSLFDSMIFMGLKAEVWLRSDADGDSLFTDQSKRTSSSPAKIAGILGAGNVSAIPATDTLYKIFHDGEAVLLKLNPINEYLEPYFTDAFRPLIDANLLRIVRGGQDVGEWLVKHPQIDSLHITGSHLTHDAIVWGTDPEQREHRRQANDPLVTKPITSELGNVTPWIIVPGRYTKKQLQAQAEHIVASIVNNASFNCVATKVIVTSRNWAQRDEFLALVESLLDAVPRRIAYYPGARERFERATGESAPNAIDGSLPWILIRDTNPDDSPHLFEEESFVGVCAETALDEASPVAFLEKAVDFVNERLFGTLCATITIPNGFQKQESSTLDQAISKLRYGSVCINQWSGVVYGMMTPPWGGYRDATIASPQSGIGSVHNTFCLKNIDKTVLWGPLCNTPKPVWFPSHRTSHKVGWALLRLYERPSLTRLPAVFYNALKG